MINRREAITSGLAVSLFASTAGARLASASAAGPFRGASLYRGALSPFIAERPDLGSFDVLRIFLRNGSGSMPPFRRTEITDDDIAAIAAYFARTSSEL